MDVQFESKLRRPGERLVPPSYFCSKLCQVIADQRHELK
jgi:hypothetical protein